MDSTQHPFGYTVAMRQALLTAAFAVAIVAAPLTVALFATPVFANSFYGTAATIL